MITVTPTRIADVLIVESPVYEDARGYFTEVFHAQHFATAGLPTTFVQDSHSHSVRHTVRGMHYQADHVQGKLVRVVTGTVFDVVVDLRRHSPTFASWVSVTLTAGDGRQLWIPPGLAHGFLTLSESADMTYKLTDFYHPASERSLAWDDPAIGIDWPLPTGIEPLLSQKDAAAPRFPDAFVYP